jgi:precorrin-3B synthase
MSNSIEEIKKRKDGLDVLADIYRYAREGAPIAPDDEALLKWYGVYTQRPASDGYYMVRIRIPGGDLTPAALHTIADLADEHGRGLADVTVRQNVQLHWVRFESLPDILDRLRAVGLSTTEACGDCVRNIINCPVSGVDEEEIYDATPLVNAVNTFFIDNREFSNLPRKFKIAITGCSDRCVYPEINDIGLFAVRDPERGVAFRARVGGGLSTTPRFARDLGVLVTPDEVVPLCAAIASVFRDEGNRGNRKRARLKFLVEAWEVPRFRAAVEERLGRQLRRAPEPEAEPVATRDRTHLGVHPQKDGRFYVGVSFVGGRTSGSGLRRLASLAEQFGSGRVRATNTQNIILLDVPAANLPRLKAELDRDGFVYAPSWARRAVIACTGIQFCKLAVSETKNHAERLTDYLERTLDLEDPVRISVTGCPNSCGQHHICDIGLEGAVTTVDGVKREAFQLFLGGGVGAIESFGRRVGVRIPSEILPETLGRLLSTFKERRHAGETFQEFCRRHTNEEIAEFLAAPEPAVAAHGEA